MVHHLAAGATLADLVAELGPIPLPDALIATRANSLEGWVRAGSRDISHPQWLIATKDVYGRLVERCMDHDAVVHPGGVKLCDSRLGADALTHRLVALATMGHSTARRFSSGRSIELLYSLDWFTRWRLSLGLWCNSALEQRHFEDYLKQLRGAPTIAYVVPIVGRIKDLAFAEAEAAQRGYRADGSRWVRLDGPSLANHLGITQDSLLSSPSLREKAVCMLGELLDVPTKAGRLRSETSLSVRRVQQLLVVLDVLQDMSTRGLLRHDPLRFLPFDREERTVSKLASRNGAEGWKLGIAPPYFLALLDAAARWVIDYAPVLLNALETMRDDPILRATGGNAARARFAQRQVLSQALDESLPPGMPKIALSWKLDIAAMLCDERISMKAAVTHLMSACFILIAGLGASSVADALRIRVGCVKEVGLGLFELAIRVEEGVRDLDAMPVPLVVAIAVRVLEALTADTRAVTGSDLLFMFVRCPWKMSASDADRNLRLEFPQKGYLVEFAAISGLPPADPETFAALTGDQLQLGFAIAYHHVIPGLPTEALTRALGQYNPMDTLDYVERSLPGAAARVSELIRGRQSAHRDAAGQAGIDDLRDLLHQLQSRSNAFEAVRCDDVLRLLKGIVDGADLPGGAGGERLVLGIQEIVDEVRRRVRLRGRNHSEAEREELFAELKQFARTIRIDRVPGRHSRCFRPITTDGLPEARCKRNALKTLPWNGAPQGDANPDRPDYKHAGIVTCSGCNHGAAFAPELAVVDAECARVAGGGGIAETDSAKKGRLARLAELRAARAAGTPSGRRIT